MPTTTFMHPLFGNITFRTASAQWIRGDKIAFLSGFDENDIIPIQIPQLTAIPGSGAGHLKFHRQGHTQLKKALADIEKAGLMKHIKTCAGTVNKRLRKPTSGGLSKIPSNHAFGIAIDLNSDDGSLGASVAPVAPHFVANGFTWGADFADPMHFEVRTFQGAAPSPAAVDAAVENEVYGDSRFIACRQRVHNRGLPPVAFLEELVAWGRAAPADVFERNLAADIYTSVVGYLGPWQSDDHRRAAMLEVMRVLGGFESSWNWRAGRDVTNPTSNTACSEEAGIFQSSGNSMSLSPGLRQLLQHASGQISCQAFIEATKDNHPFALEYCARLLRITVKHHGPIKNGHIHEWLRRDAVDELMRCMMVP